MKKADELRSNTSCLNKAANDEPLFVLRAKDPVAPMTVRLWASMAEGIHEQEKIDEAIATADQMERWKIGSESPEVVGR